ncbi:3-deoxy-manno-octulosonate cytidylyltransferase [Pelomicrobium methylotrophicum]|uniref:3-deoxy-manno-octulosonate cytidylyltransferase n=1 Tax=Pelomicrobium methylotrophicum TaxID=2602750 RepID=A0A5C7EGX9_9PROT|nr:3-deoxy-manno-octulosonate cytidylyltransferase [Pelomicrobium methylotrophicum]TXF11517.1 3-deoxy-manno-octulosonate cytidylyltransferase [Pelomicrobium methylotrophicum]
MTDFVAVIPARYASTRLPGKPLADLAGRPMVVRVAERARESGAAAVVIATDHEEIAAAARRHGFEACLTRADHRTGTDRIAEVVAVRGFPPQQVIVNVQGDEPFIDPALIREAAHHLHAHAEAAIATACHPIRDLESFLSPSVVKVVLDVHGFALYFSRAPIPYPRDAFAAGAKALPRGLPAYRHIGIYAYRAEFLTAYSGLPKTEAEEFEALEQLRALAHGYRIAVWVTDRAAPAGIDTPEDLERARLAMAKEAGHRPYGSHHN